MKRIFLVGLLLLIFLPGLVFADCAPLGRMDRWVIREDGSIVFYSGNVALGTLSLQNCTVNPASVINFPAPSVCEGDEILVDGQKCTVASLTVPES